jgi:DNA-binding NarL/FixJ family response regulator
VGEASNGRQVLERKDIDAWDVLILDLSLPKVNGPEVLRRLKARRPNLPVIVLSMYPEDQYAPQLLLAGASAYLSKDRPVEEVVAAVRAVTQGQRYVTANVADRLEREGATPEAPHLALTSREHQVFMLVIQGHAVSDIAAELDIHASTVSNHVAHIREKLGVRTMADIVNYAHRVGLVERPVLEFDT